MQPGHAAMPGFFKDKRITMTGWWGPYQPKNGVVLISAIMNSFFLSFH